VIRTSRRLLIAFVATLAVQGTIAFALWSSYSPVRPHLVCILPLSEETTLAFFGWVNDSGEEIVYEPGGSNRFEPGFQDRGQPRTFPAGASGGYPDGTFSVPFHGDSLTWRLGRRTAEATRASPLCPDARTLREMRDVTLVMPERPKPPPPPPPEPEPPPEPPPAKADPTPAPEPTRKPNPQVARRGQPKPDKPPPPRPPRETPPEPLDDVPLVLEGVTDLGRGVGVQRGDRDILGDPGVAATDRNTEIDLVDDPSDLPTKVGDGTGGGGPPPRVAPRVKQRVAGVYPEDAPRLGRTVMVRLSLLVGTDGRVRQVRIVRGAGGAFDREAESVGRQLLFHPGTVGGEPTEQWVPWVVEFSPDDW